MRFRFSIDRGDTPGQYQCLLEHFWWRFFDLESIAAPQVEKNLLIFQTLALCILPGALKSFLLFPKYGHYMWRPIAERDLATLDDKCFFLALSMILIGFLSVFEWEALFPDRKDYLILTPFPIKIHTVFLAKISALSLYLLAFTVAIDLCPTVLFPLGVLAKRASTFACTRYVLSHAVSVLLINVFIYLSAISLRGIILTLFPGRIAKSISRWIRFFCLLVLLCALFSFPGVPPANELIHSSSPLNVFYPPLWFLGIYELLLGSRDPAIWNLAGRAVSAVAISGALSILTYAACFRKFMSNSIESAGSESITPAAFSSAGNFALHQWLIRKPEDRASFHFVGQTLFRDPRHILYVGSFLAVGISIAAMSLIGVLYGTDRSVAPYLEVVILAIPLILSFFLLVGIRISFAVPVELEANWLFRMAPKQEIKRSHPGVRKYLIGAIIIPLFALTVLAYALIWDWQVALFHACYGLLLSLILVELLLLRFPKIPFTCSYLPGAARLIFIWPIYVFAFAFYGFLTALIESWLFKGTHRFDIFCIVAAVVWLVLLICNASASNKPLRFEEESESAPVYLDLHN
jgi:hypothetical protein